MDGQLPTDDLSGIRIVLQEIVFDPLGFLDSILADRGCSRNKIARAIIGVIKEFVYGSSVDIA